jgi:hypothetical protein
VSILDPRIGNNVAAITVLQTETGDNAAAIIAESVLRTDGDSALASTLALIGAQNGGATAFIMDTATVKVDSDGGDTFATRLSNLSAADSTNAADIVTIETVTIPGVESDVTALEARYGVLLNVNGYVSGFVQNNDGATGSFVILADKFAIVDASGDPAETEYVPFLISGGKITMTGDVEINGSLLLNGSVVGSALVAGTIGSTQIGANAITTTQLNANAVTADKINALAVTAGKINVTNLAAIQADLGSITAGNITLDNAGFIRGGQDAFNSGTGFFLGYETDAYKFSIGNVASGNYISWDGDDLVVRGNVSIGQYTADATEVMLAANTLRTSLSEFSFNEVKRFSTNRPGTVSVYYDYKIGPITGGHVTDGSARIKLDGTIKETFTFSNTSFLNHNYTLTIAEGDAGVITLEVQSGVRDTADPVENITSVQNVQIRAIKSDGESVVTD